jgi:recombination protein U
MAKNPGKAFEEDIKKSVPDWCWIYRFKDGTANFAGEKNQNVRFQAHNICDFMVMANERLYLLELKSHKGASIPFSCIRPKQLEEMAEITYPNITAFFLLNFRDIERTYAVRAGELKKFIETTDRKSVPIQWCIDQGIEIPSERKRTRFRYDLESLLKL